jgi:hypothetical protein
MAPPARVSSSSVPGVSAASSPRLMPRRTMACGQHLGSPDAFVVLGHAGDGAGFQPEPHRGPAVQARVEVQHLDGEFGEVAAERAGVGVGHP